tara:strand:- start:536 stop:796 length:261 start_codon:yes stop_codon:yes gene_type:complete
MMIHTLFYSFLIIGAVLIQKSNATEFYEETNHEKFSSKSVLSEEDIYNMLVESAYEVDDQPNDSKVLDEKEDYYFRTKDGYFVKAE